ncbi:hypothetical protein [Nocardia sp. NPDC057455]
MASEGLPVQAACRLLDVAESGYYHWRSRAPSQRFWTPHESAHCP